MKKKVLIQFSSRAFMNNQIFNVMDRNNLSAGWHYLKKNIEDLGYEFSTADDHSLENCAGIIFHNADSLYKPLSISKRIENSLRKLFGMKINPINVTRDLYSEAIKAGLRDKLLLIVWEPKTVLKDNYTEETWSKFDKMVTWDDSLLDDKRFTQFYVPMEGNKILEKPIPFNEKKLLVSASINKYSNYKYELYTARRKAYDYFDKYYPNDFDFYGARWNKPATRMQKLFPFLVKKYKTYRGFADNKFDILSRYKFNLCYENTSDAHGYVCDKIFTSFHARAVPIYWGACNIEDYIDTDTFVDRRKFNSDKELADYLISVDEKRYDEYLQAAERFMKSEKYKKFLPENFCLPIIKALNLSKQNE